MFRRKELGRRIKAGAVALSNRVQRTLQNCASRDRAVIQPAIEVELGCLWTGTAEHKPQSQAACVRAEAMRQETSFKMGSHPSCQVTVAGWKATSPAVCVH